MMRLRFAAVALLLASVSMIAAGQERPGFLVPTAIPSPTIDGRLDEAC